MTVFGQINQFTQRARSPSRARSAHYAHTELANELGKNIAVATRTGQDSDTFPSVSRILPNESQSDAKNAVVLETNPGFWGRFSISPCGLRIQGAASETAGARFSSPAWRESVRDPLSSKSAWPRTQAAPDRQSAECACETPHRADVLFLFGSTHGMINVGKRMRGRRWHTHL